MVNVIVLVGKVKELPEVEVTSKGNVFAHMLLECERSFRNEDGSISTDIFKVTLWRGIAEECAAVCREGSLVAVKGRIKAENYQKNDKLFYNYEIIAEKVSFLNNRMQ